MKILYITTNFSSLTHTFITREIAELRRNGCEIRLLSLRDVASEKQSKNPECDLSGMHFFYPLSWLVVFSSVMKTLFARPGKLLSAAKIAVSDPDSTIRGKAKLVYQLFATTAHLDWIEKEDFDHIHSHFASPPTSIALFLHLLTGVSFSFTGHGADVFRDHSALFSKLKYANGVVAISEYNLKHYQSIQPDLQSVALVHCGIVLSDFSFRHRTEPGDPLRVLAVGRFVAKKGYADLVRALRLLSDWGIPWQADFAGEGPLLAEMKALAKSLNVDDRLVFLGSVHQDEIRNLLAKADVFALPSVPCDDGDIDGIPVSLMEAMATGCPSVSTSVSGIPELITDGKTGLLVPPSDPEALAKGIERLARDRGLYAELSRHGREIVEADFDLTGSGRKLQEYFKTISA